VPCPPTDQGAVPAGIPVHMSSVRPHLGFLAVLLGLVVAFGTFTVFGRSGVARLSELNECKRALTDRAFRLLQENQALRERITRFHDDDRYLEELARTRLGMVRDGDIIYRFSDPEDIETRTLRYGGPRAAFPHDRQGIPHPTASPPSGETF